MKYSNINIQPKDLDIRQAYRVKIRGRWVKICSLKDVYRVLRIRDKITKEKGGKR